jgi:hypothetical protein
MTLLNSITTPFPILLTLNKIMLMTSRPSLTANRLVIGTSTLSNGNPSQSQKTPGFPFLTFLPHSTSSLSASTIVTHVLRAPMFLILIRIFLFLIPLHLHLILLFLPILLPRSLLLSLHHLPCPHHLLLPSLCCPLCHPLLPSPLLPHVLSPLLPYVREVWNVSMCHP